MDDVDFKTRRCVVASWREENDGRLLRAECDSTTKGESRAYVLFDNVDFKLPRCVVARDNELPGVGCVCLVG